MTQLGKQAILSLSLLLLALGGCSSDSGGNNPVFGQGQDPDPATPDFAIAYVKRTLPTPPEQPQDDARELLPFSGDADLYLRDQASPSARERNITARITGEASGEDNRWDVKDVDASFDGRKILFAMRGPMIPNAAEEEQPTWNIWEYNLDTDELRRAIASDNLADDGHDIAPHYLPDGRIVFSSTRQQDSGAVLTDEGKDQFAGLDENGNEPAFVLHVMNPDGTGINQISFNQSHDRDPTVQGDGRIVFTRWDHAPGNDGMHLYSVNPDGRGLQLLFGANSHDAEQEDGTPILLQYVQPRPLEDGNILTLLRPFAGSNLGADIGSNDTDNYVENFQPTLPNRGILSGPATEDVVINEVRLDGLSPSPGGLFNAAFPLFDGSNRFFVSWSPCRAMIDDQLVLCTEENLEHPDVQAAPPLYGIWIYDRTRDTLQPVVSPQEGLIITDVVALQPRTAPPVILDGVRGVDLDPNLFDERAGVLDIRSVYDIDGALDVLLEGVATDIATVRDPARVRASNRPARFLRIEKAVSIPDEQVRDFRDSAFGASNFMREILGYAPVEPDGSVRVKVPANVAFAISVVDSSGRRISDRHGHNNWLQVRPGEILQCNGCHDPDTGESHGRQNLFPTLNTGATQSGAFPNTNSALSAVEPGETMAQIRNRVMCNGACKPSVNLVFDDYWPAASIPRDSSFQHCYRQGDTDVPTDPGNPAAPPHNCPQDSSLRTTPPASQACEQQWTPGCRVVIHYPTHIHPLWTIDRTVAGVNRRCNICHNGTTNAGQLNLSSIRSNVQPDHILAYRELLFPDGQQTPNITPPMRAGSASASRFFSRFNSGASHAGYLSVAELRLIAEWLDIGAQYYNNPFDAPLN